MSTRPDPYLQLYRRVMWGSSRRGEALKETPEAALVQEALHPCPPSAELNALAAGKGPASIPAPTPQAANRALFAEDELVPSSSQPPCSSYAPSDDETREAASSSTSWPRRSGSLESLERRFQRLRAAIRDFVASVREPEVARERGDAHKSGSSTDRKRATAELG